MLLRRDHASSVHRLLYGSKGWASARDYCSILKSLCSRAVDADADRTASSPGHCNDPVRSLRIFLRAQKQPSWDHPETV